MAGSVARGARVACTACTAREARAPVHFEASLTHRMHGLHGVRVTHAVHALRAPPCFDGRVGRDSQVTCANLTNDIRVAINARNACHALIACNALQAR